MALPENSSDESKQVAEAEEAQKEEKEEEPPCSIDPLLLEAFEHPYHGKILIHMESEIQQFIGNPELQNTEFLQCISSRLRKLVSLLLRHYGLEPDCTEKTKVLATKTPDSRIPSITLSGITKFNPKYKHIIPTDRCSSDDTSSSNLSAPEMSEPEKRGSIWEERGEKADSNLSSPELTEPEKRASTLEEGKEVKPTSNMSAQDTIKAEKRIRTEEEEEKPTSNLSAQEMREAEKSVRSAEKRKEDNPISELSVPDKTEPKKGPRTSEEMKDVKPTSNMSAQDTIKAETMVGIEEGGEEKLTSKISAQEMTEAEKRKEEKPNNNSCTPEKTDLEKRDRTLEERQENKPLTSVDPRLADAVRHTSFSKILLSMEVKIQEVIQNPNLQEVEFPQCRSTHLRALAHKLALHYCLEPHCNEGLRVYARKRPESRIPRVTLSEIRETETSTTNLEEIKEEKAASNSSADEAMEAAHRAGTLEKREEEDKLTNSIKKCSGDASSSNLSVHAKSEPEKMTTILDTREEVEPPISVDPRLADAIQHPQIRRIFHSELVAKDGPDNSTAPVVSSSLSAVVSKSKPEVDSSSIPPVGSSSISPVVSNSISPVVATSASPVISCSISTVCSGLVAEDSQHNLSGTHAVVHNPSSDLNNSTRSVNQRGTLDQQHQQMQYGASVSQPASTPHMRTPNGNNIMSYPCYSYGATYYSPYSNFAQWPPVQYNTQPYYASGSFAAYSSSTQCPPVQYMETYDAIRLLHNPAYASYTQRPSVQYMETYDASRLLYNPAYASYTQRPSVQYTQPFSPEPMQDGSSTLSPSRPSVDTTSEQYSENNQNDVVNKPS